MSLAVLPLTVPCALLSAGSVGPADICVDLWWALQVLMLYPSSHEPVLPSLRFGAVSLLLAAGLTLAGAQATQHIVTGSALALMSALYRCRCRYADVAPLFHISAVWHGVEGHCSLIHMGIVLWEGVMVPAMGHSAWTAWCWAGVLLLSYATQYYRIYTRSTLLLGRDKEILIRKTQRGSAFRQPIQYVDSDSRSAELFNDVVRIMENRKPWLQDDFSIDDLARLAHTNRVYLSKSVNFHSGRNFNQLVNFYRVRYAVELIRKDPSLRMNEVSRMCGFHTVVSFNMAFKLNERMTPTEFAQSLKKLI